MESQALATIELDDIIDQAAGALRRGRRGVEAPTFVREITAEDFPRILTETAEPSGSTPIAKLRHTHHLVARCLAEGKSTFEAAAITGYTPQRVRQLAADPAFQELLAYYKDQVREKWLNVQERLASLGVAITEELQERLAEAPENFSNEELRKWAETLFDRSGFGPRSTRDVNVRGTGTMLHLIEQVKRESEDTAVVKLLQAAE